MGFTAMMLEVISTVMNTATTMIKVPVNRMGAPLSLLGCLWCDGLRPEDFHPAAGRQTLRG